MNFFEAIRSGFSVYTDDNAFQGRASRSEFLWWWLFSTLINLIPFAILITFIPSISVMVRRLHDTNRSGWNYWWIFTIVGLIPVLYWLYFKAGDEGDNFYGTNPDTNLNIDFNNISKLEKLAKLKEQGHLTEEEYNDKKKELL
tara:strand:+ start:1164 stop:1592 length:429 start_codon:yes stop_codon:yes gene_type:complete